MGDSQPHRGRLKSLKIPTPTPTILWAALSVPPRQEDRGGDVLLRPLEPCLANVGLLERRGGTEVDDHDTLVIVVGWSPEDIPIIYLNWGGSDVTVALGTEGPRTKARIGRFDFQPPQDAECSVPDVLHRSVTLDPIDRIVGCLEKARLSHAPTTLPNIAIATLPSLAP